MKDIEKMYPQKTFLTEDFIKLSNGLTEKYHPKDLTALANIGAVLLAMHQICSDYEKQAVNYAEPKIIKSERPKMESKDDILAELKDAKKYCKKWQETHDNYYHGMAKDELKHANILMHKIQITDPMKKQEYMNKYNWLERELG